MTFAALRFRGLLVAGLGLALASLALAGASNAPAATDCGLIVDAPASYYGIAVITSASVECATAKNTLRFSMTLTRDGAVVGTSERTCHKRPDCWSYVLVDDAPGDQTWCTTATARVGSVMLPPLTRCETDGAL